MNSPEERLNQEKRQGKIPPLTIDPDFYTDPKVRSLEAKLGEVAILRLVKLWGIMWKAEGTLQRRFFPGICRQIGVKENWFEKFIDVLLEFDLLIDVDGNDDIFLSSGLRRRWTEWERKVRASRARWDAVSKKVPASCSSDDVHYAGDEDEHDTEDEDDTEPEGGEESKGEGKKPPDEPKSPPPKPIKPKFDPTGLIKLAENVFVKPGRFEKLKLYYAKKNLDLEDLQEAIRELDRWFEDNPKKRQQRTDDAKALCGWPLTNALKRKTDLLRLKRQEELNQQGGLRR